MATNAPSVTEAELAVLQVLWAFGLATIREIRDELYPDGGTSEYSTVQKLLERLEAKTLVKRSRREVPHTFAAKLDRDAFVGQRITELADSLCGGSLVPIVSHLVQRRDLKAGERAELQQLIAQVIQVPKKGGSTR